MKLFPAIDLRGGKVVRLLRGEFDAQTVYGDDPIGVARQFQAEGAGWIHVVDLDAAQTGTPLNRELIASIKASVNVPVQAGAGVRDRSSGEALLATGVDRIVIGTAAVEQPELVDWLAQKYPGRVAVGIDSRDGLASTRGWTTGLDGVTALDLVKRFSTSGVAAFVVTDISRDGTLLGPDIVGLSAVLEATDVDVVASGGVGTIDDIWQLRKVVDDDGRELAGVIVGKALYERRFTVAEAIVACGDGS